MDIFPVFDPISQKFEGNKPRSVVHSKGLWHIAVQAHLIRLNKQGKFDIYIQKRSEVVDIGQFKYDQSLATQMLQSDNLSPLQTLRRGLADELQIDSYESYCLPLNLRIMKYYHDQPHVQNNEILYLFLVKSSQEPNIVQCSKISHGSWVSWENFIHTITYSDATKTAQMYVKNQKILQVIERESMTFLLNQHKNSVKSDETIFFTLFPLDANSPSIFYECKNSSELICTLSYVRSSSHF